MSGFCVYEHWRPDTGKCFYVGKGTEYRARRTSRKDNVRYSRIVAKLKRSDIKVEVKIVASNMSEKDAFDFEIKHIAFCRARFGDSLVNQTVGGEGAAGCLRGKPQSAEHIAALAAARLRKKAATTENHP